MSTTDEQATAEQTPTATIEPEPQPRTVYFMVWSQGVDGNWLPGPVGVYAVEDGDQAAHNACMAAAHKRGGMGNYFAVQGTPWGLSLTESPASEYGVNSEAVDSLVDVLADRAMERLRPQLRAGGLR